jgi:hypothetical protein
MHRNWLTIKSRVDPNDKYYKIEIASSGIPRRLWNLIQQFQSPQFSILIRNGVVQRMRPDIPPEPVQAHLLACSLCTRDFEYARRNS